MTEYKTFDDYVRNILKIEPTELTHISPEEQKKKTVEITADELINIWNELTELKADNDARKFAMVMSEKVEKQLRKENSELKKTYRKQRNKRIDDLQKENATAKKIISEYIDILKGNTKNWRKTQEKAEQFLKEVKMTKEYSMEYTKEDELLDRVSELELENAIMKKDGDDLSKKFDYQVKRVMELEKENAELDCQKNRNKFCYSCANATERCFRNEIGCPCEKYKSYKDENAKLKTDYEVLSCSVGDFDELQDKLEEEQRKNNGLSDNLTTAKEIISEYVRLANLEKEDTVAIWQLYHKAEQFLNSEAEKDKEKPEAQRRELSFDHQAMTYVGE